jgi:alkaline phosphatase
MKPAAAAAAIVFIAAACKSSTDFAPHPQRAPRNVIVMIADGLGFNHIHAADYWQHGEADRQAYSRFPVRLAMSTFAADPEEGGGYDAALAWSTFDHVTKGATDSAAAATAMSTGVKTYNAAIGVGLQKERLRHLADRAKELGKATGVVTTVQFSHATPAGFVAHNERRSNYEAIASEMVLESSVDLIMGCGHPFYDDNSLPGTGKDGFRYVGGESTWNALLLGSAGADANGDGAPDRWTLLETREAFQALGRGATPRRVIGVPQVHTTLQQNRDGDKHALPFAVPFTTTVPTLAEMTRAALNILGNDPDGLFLMVEGGAVDWAAHDNQSGRMIEEMLDFDRAVEAVLEWMHRTGQHEHTLLIVTGDHETGYLTGPGSGPEADPMWKPLANNGRSILPGMQWNSRSHTNSLVPFFAIGPASKLFTGKANGSDPVYGPFLDNTDIARVIFAAM